MGRPLKPQSFRKEAKRAFSFSQIERLLFPYKGETFQEDRQTLSSPCLEKFYYFFYLIGHTGMQKKTILKTKHFIEFSTRALPTPHSNNIPFQRAAAKPHSKKRFSSNSTPLDQPKISRYFGPNPKA